MTANRTGHPLLAVARPGQPHPHHRPVIAGIAQGGVRVGRVNDAVRIDRDAMFMKKTLERVHLSAREIRIKVRAGEMREDSRQPELSRLRDHLQQRPRLFRSAPAPAHAGVDLQMYRQGLIESHPGSG